MGHECPQLLVGSTLVICDTVSKLDGGGCPNQCDHTFRDHGTVENESSLCLVFQTSGHHRALCGMETAYCTTGYGDTETREDGNATTGMMIAEGGSNLG